MLRRLNDEPLRLAADEDQTPDDRHRQPWKLLIVDDEEEVHLVTRIVLRNYEFEGSPVQLLSAYSGVAARRELRRNPDIAVILLDVVMEREDAGLRLVRFIRNEVGNRKVRIILRTGQPGQAPEQEVVAQYDINDYRAKTELTAARLCTTVTSALRSWRDLCELERSREGLQRVIRSQGALFRWRSRDEFATGVLDELLGLAVPREAAVSRDVVSGLVARVDDGPAVVIAGRGRYAGHEGELLARVASARTQHMFGESARRGRSLFYNNSWVANCRSDGGESLLFHLRGGRQLGNLDRDLVRIYMAGVEMAFRNAHLSLEIIDAQKEMIHTLGEVVETRSRETAHHVLRVGEMAGLLGELAGVDPDEAALLRLAAPMHDVGKVGIPDAILNKPARLTEAEYEIMRGHAVIGHAILGKSRRRIMQVAARIALEHHERWDGRGYPHGRQGEEIHLHGRITAVVDVFDALTNRRVYRGAMGLEEVVGILRKERGGHFDPRLVDLFMANFPRFQEIARSHPDVLSVAARAGSA